MFRLYKELRDAVPDIATKRQRYEILTKCHDYFSELFFSPKKSLEKVYEKLKVLFLAFNSLFYSLCLNIIPKFLLGTIKLIKVNHIVCNART